jgi:predicted nucleic acid-binding protein
VGSGRLTAVADTGPLIHLAEVGCLPLLAIFEELHIPEGVWQEATRPSTIREVLTFSKRHALTSTDDLAVRRAAKALDLTPVGSLGVITRAHEMGRVATDVAEQHLRALYTVSSLFVTSTIVDLAIERLRS